jgi:hypothetical protein
MVMDMRSQGGDSSSSMKKSAEGKRGIMTKTTTRVSTSTKTPAKGKERVKTEASGYC